MVKDNIAAKTYVGTIHMYLFLDSKPSIKIMIMLLNDDENP